MASAFAHIPEADLDPKDEPWFIQPKDKDPCNEFARQSAFVNFMRKHSGAIVYAVPNGGRLSEWQRLRRWREGMVTGALDLEIKWHGGRCFVAEFKDGRGMPSREQRHMLNRLYRAGVPCGVYRTPAQLVAHLRALGCPIAGPVAKEAGE